MNNINLIKNQLARLFSIPWYVIVISGLLFLLALFFLRNTFRAAFLSTLWLMLFFSYGHVYQELLQKWENFNFKPYLLIAWLVLFTVFCIWATRPRFTFRDTVLALNVVSLGLMINPTWQISTQVQSGAAQ